MNSTKIAWSLFADPKPMGLSTTGLSAPVKNEISARVGSDGFLYISKPRHPAFNLFVMPGGNYHNYDYALFYMNIRQNVEYRLAAYMDKG